MLLTLSERVTADLNLLGAIPDAAYVGQFCQVALEFLQTGAKKGMFTRAATALGVEPEVVAACIAALCHVLLESARANLSANELSSSLGDVAMTEAGKKTIAEFYTANQKALRDKLQSGHGAGIGSSPSVPEYRNLDWRLEIEVSSRYAHDVMQPSFTCRLDTVSSAVAAARSAGEGDASSGSSRPAAEGVASSTAAAAADISAAASTASAHGPGPHSLHFSADFATLQAVAAALEEAAAEMKTAHSKRVLRYIH